MADHDSTLFLGTAQYYLQGRPPYSQQLVPTLVETLKLDGTGKFLDVGCGPGSLTIALAPHFEQALAIDPQAEMLQVAQQQAQRANCHNIAWQQARAEDLGDLGLSNYRLVTFGQSFHWTNRALVAKLVYDILAPGGAIALITHNVEGRPKPSAPKHPPIPHDAIKALIASYLGPQRRAGQGYFPDNNERFSDTLARSPFGSSSIIYCQGRSDLIRSIDDVLANYLSTSFAAPHLFGPRFAEFEGEFRQLLQQHTDTGFFWEWPGDTEIILARKG